MNRSLRQMLILLLTAGTAIAAAVLFFSGRVCDIRGTVTRDGQPLKWSSEGGHLLVLFIPVNRRADSPLFRADTNRETGEFTVTGIPSGKYRVAIQQFDEHHNDALNHVYNPGVTDLIREIHPGEPVVDIDLPAELPKMSNAGPAGPAGSGKKRDR